MNANVKYTLELFKKKRLRILTDPVSAVNEFIEDKKYQQNQALLKQIDFSKQDLDTNRALMDRFSAMSNLEPKTVNWFLPAFTHAYGGVTTTLRFAEYFHSQKGIQNRFIICGTEEDSESVTRKAISKVYPNLSGEKIIMLTGASTVENLPEADISIATYWITAYPLLKFNKTLGKFYFIQDYEPLFFPAGFIYGLAEATYRFGFRAITNTAGLYYEYTKNYGDKAEYFTPSVDKKIFYTTPRTPKTPTPESPFLIFFYGRPISRNGFELGVAALKKVKKRYGNRIKIFSAGSNWSRDTYDPQGDIVNLGVLPYEKTAELYRNCDLGVVFMFTKHPSYLPFELMACGCPVLTNTNSATAWFLKDNLNCALTEPTVSSVAERIATLIENPDLREHLSINGLKSIGETNWESEIEKIYRFICNTDKTSMEH